MYLFECISVTKGNTRNDGHVVHNKLHRAYCSVDLPFSSSLVSTLHLISSAILNDTAKLVSYRKKRREKRVKVRQLQTHRITSKHTNVPKCNIFSVYMITDSRNCNVTSQYFVHQVKSQVICFYHMSGQVT